MFKEKVGKYDYPLLEQIIEDIPGCMMCIESAFKQALLEDRLEEEIIKQDKRCNNCIITQLTEKCKEYAEKLAEIDKRYEDDGK